MSWTLGKQCLVINRDYATDFFEHSAMAAGRRMTCAGTYKVQCAKDKRYTMPLEMIT